MIYFEIKILWVALSVIPIKMTYKFITYFLYPHYYKNIGEFKNNLLVKFKIRKPNNTQDFGMKEDFKNLMILKFTLLQIIDIMNIFNVQVIIFFFRISNLSGNAFYSNIDQEIYWILFYQALSEIICEVIGWVILTYLLKREVPAFKKISFYTIFDDYKIFVMAIFQFVYFITFLILGNNYVQEFEF